MDSTLIVEPVASDAAARAFFAEVRAGLEAGRLAPYLGPGVLASASSTLPSSHEELAKLFGKRIGLPRRARGNMWAAAQYVESQRHRRTLVHWMQEAFAAELEPTPFHRYVAGLPAPLIVDTWYDGVLRRALSHRTDWAEIQGISRAAIGEARWFRSYGPPGKELPLTAAGRAATLLYKPLGAVTPAQNFIISDADYVEVLTEIDIQSPIPDLIKARRQKLGFVFLGCRFNEQTLRTYARQLAKRTAGPHYVVFDPAHGLTRNEQRFMKELELNALFYPWSDTFATLARGSLP